MFGRVCGVEFSVHHSHGENFVIRHSGCAGDVGQCVQSGTCGSVFAKQSPIRGRANAAGSQQTKSGNPFVFRGGWEWGVSGRGVVFDHPSLRLLLKLV